MSNKPTPFVHLAQATSKDLSVIEFQAGKAFSRLIGKGFQSGDVLVALSLLYHSTLDALEQQQPGLKMSTHSYMLTVFNEMAGIMPEEKPELPDDVTE